MEAHKRNSESGRETARRIDTQIHRRKKAKAVPPLQAEWDVTEETPPTKLRMPSENMSRSK
ncbi:MAG: hypothetical protein ACE5NA_05060 [Nitrospiraceae bacterium]